VESANKQGTPPLIVPNQRRKDHHLREIGKECKHVTDSRKRETKFDSLREDQMEEKVNVITIRSQKKPLIQQESST
jgi:hypothetical protein